MDVQSSAMRRAQQLREEYAERAEKSQEGAKEWLREKLERLYVQATNKSEPLEAVEAYETIAQIAEI